MSGFGEAAMDFINDEFLLLLEISKPVADVRGSIETLWWLHHNLVVVASALCVESLLEQIIVICRYNELESPNLR